MQKHEDTEGVGPKHEVVMCLGLEKATNNATGPSLKSLTSIVARQNNSSTFNRYI